MTQKKVGGYIFRIYQTDHPPYHVHIFYGSHELGRFDIENQRPMDAYQLTPQLRKALKRAGYLQ